MHIHSWSSSSSHKQLPRREISSPQIFVGSFLLLILVGTAALKLLPGVCTNEPLNWLDALFTSTSAVCVTGLIVTDTATRFTTFGQGIILVLIQLGGLGIITFTTLVISSLGRRLPLHHAELAQSATEITPHVDPRRLTRQIVKFTLAIELLGAVALWAFWVPRFGWIGAIWHAVFHSISAFCNAGFSTFSDSLTGFATAPHVLAVIMLLIIAGGIGFLTMEEVNLWRKSRRKQRRVRISLHSRLVIITTAALILGGWILYTAFEWTITLGHLPTWARVVNGLFMSVTCRTAGFNSVDYGMAADSTNFLTMILMQIGGSPGSTAGGFKTTTLALLALMSWARLRGRDTVDCFGRTIPEETTQRAVGLFMAVSALVVIAVFVFTISDLAHVPHPAVEGGFLPLAFETVSAFNTVGLSMGMTPHLTSTGHWITIILMFLGRVGPLTVFSAMIRRRHQHGKSIRFGYEDVVVG